MLTKAPMKKGTAMNPEILVHQMTGIHHKALKAAVLLNQVMVKERV